MKISTISACLFLDPFLSLRVDSIQVRQVGSATISDNIIDSDLQYESNLRLLQAARIQVKAIY